MALRPLRETAPAATRGARSGSSMLEGFGDLAIASVPAALCRATTTGESGPLGRKGAAGRMEVGAEGRALELTMILEEV
jgi:hypothetical protein